MTFVPANEPWLDKFPADWRPSRIRNVAQLSPSYSDGPPAPDRWALDDDLAAVAQRWSIDPARQLTRTA